VEDLEGRVAVVTGAASGIGLALAQRLASEGMRVVLADLPGQRLDAAASEVTAHAGEAAAGAPAGVLAVPADVCDEAALRAIYSGERPRLAALAL
jgi:NAD(P)-dependent dehydrogenase (short-subunit alcohol dehydrogenase family)